jgi:hypothetical protein
MPLAMCAPHSGRQRRLVDSKLSALAAGHCVIILKGHHVTGSAVFSCFLETKNLNIFGAVAVRARIG